MNTATAIQVIYFPAAAGQHQENEEKKTLSSAVLYIFSGLPGSGKSNLAGLLAQHIQAAYLRIDTIEQALRDICSIKVEGEGYRLAYRLGADILATGVSVVADSCNPIELTREEWQDVALANDAGFTHIEVICSDPLEHRRRVETRTASIPGLRLPTWQEVQKRPYDPWTRERIMLDTANKNEQECLLELLSHLGRRIDPQTGSPRSA